jgi:mannosyl-3-phosphoglycerate phosphatase
MPHDRKLLIFTDLDGTLLDYHTYSFDAARPALDRIVALDIPLVIISSKTRSEIEFLMKDLPFRPLVFVAENCSAIYFLDDPASQNPYRAREIGVPYREVLEGLWSAREEYGADILGFSNMSVEEISALTGLDIEAAARAKNREYSEPFLLKAGQDIHRLQEALGIRGLLCIEGGRFWHAMGRYDKGIAVRMIFDFYRESYPGTDWETVGLGDSPNDYAMLEAVDFAVVIQRYDGSYADYESRPGQLVIRVPGKGPVGWNQAILDLIEKGI